MAFTQHVLSKTPEVVTSEYGPRTHPVTGIQNSYHKGIDLIGAGGSVCDVVAMAAGTVKTVDYNSGRGYYVVIRHNGTYDTLYQHLAKGSIPVKVGQAVSTGQKIGYMGSTGQSTGPHLHLEVHKNGAHTDPRPYLEGQETIDGNGGIMMSIRRGDKGVHVTILQGYLVKRGHYTGELDGSFGPATESAVKALQSAGGLAVDGICGPVTAGYIAGSM